MEDAVGLVAEATHAKGIDVVVSIESKMPGDRERCLEAGMAGYLSKPFQPTEPEGVLERLDVRPPAAHPASALDQSAAR